ncbi:S26 family signal peptidase [Microbispora cellulosiformans]|uniref:S26 family signal peptidase n=1 Tax=Microbispora cellulosiformans TaxID=2614688 RepID=A0A5J5K410_9ACTN|nr:S26 family signal peptidase [Microbispora cellulosiformans]KAA9379153.1 S26 family signal peptidase [Microbispora cellulosiformans]
MLTILLLVAAVALPCAAVVAVLRRRYVVVEVHGTSMRPSLHAGDRVLVRRVPPRRVRVGEVVVVEAPGLRVRHPGPPREVPGPDRRWHIKRVAAVGGDPVPARVADTPALRDAACVPAGHLVVLGDNPDKSLDSRQRGFVPDDRVLGVVLRRLPPERRR